MAISHGKKQDTTDEDTVCGVRRKERKRSEVGLPFRAELQATFRLETGRYVLLETEHIFKLGSNIIQCCLLILTISNYYKTLWKNIIVGSTRIKGFK